MENTKIYICKHCGKLFINRYLLTGHSTHCLYNPNYEQNKISTNNLIHNKDKNKVRKIDKYYECNCLYCNKQYFSMNSLRLHEIRCSENPNKKLSGIEIYNNLDHIVWNKGLTSKTSNSIKKQSKTLSNRYKNNEIVSPLKGKPHTEREKLKLRESSLKYLKTIIPGFHARYNKNACEFIDNLNEDNNWNLQHAENGGEVECLGYYLDGYDKEKNIVFEYDESRHYKDVYNNVLTDKDIERLNNIINELQCEFWRYNEKKDLLYKVN